MNLDELRAVVAGGESDRLEFKASTGQRSDGAKTIAAMLNGQGGFVLFGVTDRGELRGQQVSTSTLEDLARELRKIDPLPLLEPERVSLPTGHEVIVVSVPSRAGAAFTYDGRPFIRIGPTTVPMPQDEYGRRLIERAHPNDRWEIQPAVGIEVHDLDFDQIVFTVEESVRRLRLEDPGTRDPLELLRGFRLLVGDRPLNAAVALFGRADRLLPNYPQCRLRLARFRGADKTEFLDNRQETGNVLDLLVRAQRFLRDHLPVAGRIVPNLFERQDDPLYPPTALREALANALCHRDYAIPGGSVAVAIYDDRLEITSTGGLPFGITPSDLVRPHASRPWNPLIADVLFRRGIIEQWGRGTLKILELSRAAGLMPPEFEVRGGEVVVRFYPQGYVPPSRISRDLSPLQQELLAVLAELGPSSLGAIAGALSRRVPTSTLQENLQLLRSFHLVQLDGWARGARWSVIR